MQLLLGLFFFSIFLTTGTSIQCPYCVAINGYCSGIKQECPNRTDVCMTYSLQSKGDKQMFANYETCAPKNICKEMEDLIGKPLPEKTGPFPSFSNEITVKEVTCSKAPPSLTSFFPAFLGLVLMKLLF